MGWVLLWFGLFFATHVWLCFRVGRSNAALAVATFFIGFPAALYTFIKQRGQADTSVTVPFVANVVFCALFFVTAWQTVVPLLEAQQAQEAAFSTPVPVVAPAAIAPAPASAASAPLPASAVLVAGAASQPALALDPIDAFSAALRAGGLNHTVTRVSAAASMPSGVTDAALFSVPVLAAAAGANAASATSAASAPAAEEVSATLFKCESANACRSIAQAQMQLAGPAKRRILQNGLLLLSLPPTNANDPDLTSAAVGSVFRKL